MPKKYHDGRSGEKRTHTVMKSRGSDLISEDMSKNSNLPDTVLRRNLGNSPYHQMGELPGPYEGVEKQMIETQGDFSRNFKPYK